jgi:cytochrome c peroxidase
MKQIILKLVALAGLALLILVGSRSPSEHEQATAALGDSKVLQAAYERWKAAHRLNGEDRRIILLLNYSKALSARFTNARGQATLDLVDGSLSVVVSGLSEHDAWDVWLIDNRPGPGRSVKPEPGDVMVRVGGLMHEGDTATLQAHLGHEVLAGFEVDLVVVTRAGEDPGAGGLLFGSPSLFQRLYYSEQRWRFAVADAGGQASMGLLATPFRLLNPSPAYAQTTGMEALVAEGKRIFFNERFAGNGRTCGTCHPAQNSFTLDPGFIATLPPNDPLFVAEFNSDLENLEKPVLMRQFGLILENVDGFDDPTRKFVMRGIPPTLALSTSLKAPPAPIDGTTFPPTERTGWGGDGSVDLLGARLGTLRDFATGAVIQHFPKTLNRQVGVDFRLPTEEELDALEAFQLSLGRQEDPDLNQLRLKGAVPERGRQLFLSGEARCNNCHGNAGASASAVPGNFNLNFNTGVENLDHPARAVESFPRDGGFGTLPDGQGGFGNGTFNTPPLIEAADTGPFFHNNAVTTIEDAVAFYTTPTFNNSPAGQQGQIQLAPDEVLAVAAFLRVLNTLENIRSAIALQERAQDTQSLETARPLLDFSISEIDDAIGVLSGAGLHSDAVKHLRDARKFVEKARRTTPPSARNNMIRLAITQEEAARGRMVLVEG